MRFLAVSLAAAMLFSSHSFAADLAAPTGKGIVADGAKLELLYTRTASFSGGLTEGPAVAPDGSIYFTDIAIGDDKGLIMRFDPKTKKTTVFSDDSGKANGLIFDSQGLLVACEGADQGGRCVSWWDVKTKKRVKTLDNIGGKKFNACNDLCIDRAGNIYFTDPRYLGDEPRELEHRAVYRINTGGQVEEVTHECGKPNGIALSPDGKTLYVADHDNGTDKIDPENPPAKKGPMAIYAFPLSAEGKVGKRVTLVDYGTEDGCDGMCVDAKGNIYLTNRSLKRPGVMVINPQGKEVAFIPTGPTDQKEGAAVGLPSNVEFGIAAESKVLYVTVDKSLYRIPLLVEGYHAQYAR